MCAFFVLCLSGNIRIAIILTTIPPRFPYLHLTLPSWLDQEYPVDRICLYIPQHYKRFHRKASKSSNDESMFNNVLRRLREHKQTSAMLDSQVLKVVSTDRDWGPITRFVGYARELTTNSDENCFFAREDKPDYWLVADDDVGYQPYTLSKYIQHLRIHDAIRSRKQLVLTNFSLDYRVFFKLFGQEKAHIPQHIQGVDTYLLPHLLPRTHPSLTLRPTLEILHFLHTTCPETFYQDDYLVSIWLYLYEYDVISIWSNDNLAIHIHGVSTHHHQMHMHPQVFEREERTKSCLYTYANEVYAWVRGDGDGVINVSSYV
ncbi:hypothetical protein EON65_00165 [archaeon]|nr:MAG: hypothetical protein EON65_00165 [archaeon]